MYIEYMTSWQTKRDMSLVNGCFYFRVLEVNIYEDTKYFHLKLIRCYLKMLTQTDFLN